MTAMPPPNPDSDVTQLDTTPPPGSAELGHFGRYRLLKLLGQGGMGRVYLAERTDGVHREQVALKLMQGDAEAIAELVQRFRTEREILARLHHPNIVPLLDGGEWSGGAPFLVMRYVEGTPINQWCQSRGATVETRLRLMIKVCSAVQAAHQALVVHRDLKPGNILIDLQDEPQLLDFGIAKVLDDSRFLHSVVATRADALLMTPRYASPEQVSGAAIGTATDIYALGVILYELVTGHSPYPEHSDSGLSLVKAICTIEPVPPSRRPGSTASTGSSSAPATLRRRSIDADLDAIILKALRKEPAQRYSSVDALREDLERLLDGRPVAARAGSRWYRFSKFVRRHRWWLAGSTLVLCTLVYSALSWRAQRDEVTRERDRATAVLAFMDRMLREASPVYHAGKPPTIADMAAQAAERIDRESELGPAARAQLLTTLTSTIGSQAQYAQAEAIGERAIRAAELAVDEDPLLLVRALLVYADVFVDSQQLARARPPNERALALLDQQPEGTGIPERVIALRNLSRLAAFAEDFEQALTLAEAQIELERRRLGWPALEVAQPSGSEDEWSLGSALHLRCSALYNLGRLPEAERSCLQAQALRERIYPPAHPNHHATRSTLSRLYSDLGRLQEAYRISLELHALDRQRFGPEHPETSASAANLGTDMLRLGHGAAALAPLRFAADRMAAKMGPAADRSRRLQLLLAHALHFEGDPEGCRIYAELDAATATEAVGRTRVDALLGVSKCALAAGEHDRARLTLETIELALTTLPDRAGKVTVLAALLRARLEALQGDQTAAEAALARAQAAIDQRQPQTLGQASVWLVRAQISGDPAARAAAASWFLRDASRELWTARDVQALGVVLPTLESTPATGAETPSS
jgi:serine/threonine-protein kinase